jgi:hypothetical protein
LLLLFFLPGLKNEIKEYFESQIELRIVPPTEYGFDVREQLSPDFDFGIWEYKEYHCDNPTAGSAEIRIAA